MRKINFHFSIFCILLTLLVPTGLYGSQKDSLFIDSFYQILYSYKFRSADSLLQQNVRNEISSSINNLLIISYNWWKIISGENNPEAIDSLFKKIEANIKALEEKHSKTQSNQKEIVQLIFLYSYKSRLHNYQNNRLASFSAFKQSFNYFEKLNPCDTGYCDMYNFIAGMYYALGGHLQEQFSPVFLLGINRSYADKEKGYSLLEKCTHSKNKQIQIESNYFLMKLYLEVREDPVSAEKFSGELVKLYPDNLVFRFNHLLALYNQDKFDAAEKVYRNLINRADSNPQLSEKQKEHFREEYNTLKR